MKFTKALIIFLSLAVFASAGMAQRIDPQLEAVKVERAQYMQSINALVSQYNKAPEADRVAIRQQITDIVSEQTDKDIVTRKKLLAEQKERIAKLEAQINEMEQDKMAYVSKKVDFILSPEGQKKVGEFKYRAVVVVTSTTANGIQKQITEFTSGNF